MTQRVHKTPRGPQTPRLIVSTVPVEKLILHILIRHDSTIRSRQIESGWTIQWSDPEFNSLSFAKVDCAFVIVNQTRETVCVTGVNITLIYPDGTAPALGFWRNRQMRMDASNDV